MGKYLLLIFDLDGTILDSYKSIVKSVYDTLNYFNINNYDKDKIIKNIGYPLRVYFEKLGLNDIDKVIEIYKKFYKNNSEIYHKLYPDIKKVLDYLKFKVLLSLLTNKGKLITENILKKFDLMKYFDYFLTDEDVNIGKPESYMFYKLIEKYKMEGKEIDNGDILMIGDSNIDFKFSRNCKIDFAFVKWGFYSLNDLEGLPEYVLESPYDIIKICELDKTCNEEIKPELDLHNYSLSEMKYLITNYLKECYNNNIYIVRIIHGKGKGIKRDYLRKILNEIYKNENIINKFYDAPYYNGGAGATIVELKN